MTKLLATLALVASAVFVASFAVAATTGTYNSQGAAGAQVAVSTSATKVLPAAAGRQLAYICNVGTVVEYCEAGPFPSGAPSPAPTSAGANGLPVQPSSCMILNPSSAETPSGLQLPAQVEWDCACSSGTCNTATLEF